MSVPGSTKPTTELVHVVLSVPLPPESVKVIEPSITPEHERFEEVPFEKISFGSLITYDSDF